MSIPITNQIFKKALATAKKSTVLRSKMGAVLFTNSGEIVVFASNQTCLGHGKKFTIHAEEAVIAKAHKIKANSRMKGRLSIFILRWTKTKGIRMAKPCERCAALLKKTGWNVFFTDYNGKIIKDGKP